MTKIYDHNRHKSGSWSTLRFKGWKPDNYTGRTTTINTYTIYTKFIYICKYNIIHEKNHLIF